VTINDHHSSSGALEEAIKANGNKDLSPQEAMEVVETELKSIVEEKVSQS
jgi:hypothetical protein